MKIVKIILSVLFILVVILGVAIVVFLKTFDVNKYKPQIIRQIAKVVGREITISEIALNLSLADGAALQIKNFSIKDNPEFSQGDFLAIKDIHLGVDILPFLTKHQILVSSVKIKSPKMILIRNEDGKFNAQTFKINLEKGNPHSLRTNDDKRGLFGTPAFAAESQNETVDKKTGPTLLIQSIRLDDGVLVYRDLNFNPEISFEVSQIKFTANDLSLVEPFRFSLEAALFSQKQNVDANGQIEIHTNDASIHFKDLKITSDLSDMSLHLLQETLYMLKDAGFQEGMKGRLSATISKMAVGPKGLMDLSLDGKFENGKIKLKQLPLPLTNIDVVFEATENAIKIKESSFGLGAGTMTATGDINDYLKGQKFRFQTEAKGIDLGEIIAQEHQPTQLAGKLYAQFTCEGKGLNVTALMLKSLSGEGTLDLKEARLIGINVLRFVLSKISMLPGLAEEVEKNLPENYKDKLKEQDTPFKKIRLNARIKDSSLIIDNTEAETDVFLLSGKGTLDFNQELDMQASIAIPSDLSKSMVTSVAALEYLLDEEGKIVIPLTVSGKIPALAFLPDLEYLGKKIILNKGREELEKVLEKAFGKDTPTNEKPSPPPGESPTTSPQPTPPSKEEEKKSQERELIEGILDKIFH